MRLDGSRSDDQARGPINYMTNPGPPRIAFGRYLQSIDPELDVNEGLLAQPRRVDRRARAASSSRASPRPLGMRANTRFRVLSCIFGALAQANGGRVPAGSPVYVLYYFRAWDEARRRPILCIEGLGVGLGARPFADGVDVIYYIAQENYPVEYVERDFPLRVERYAVRPDSGGPGYHRGGAGVIRDVRVLCERAELATRMENSLVAPYGVAGGRAGRTGRVILNPGTPGSASYRRWATASPSSAATSSASRRAGAAAGAIPSPAIPSACARTSRAASSPRAARSQDYGVVARCRLPGDRQDGHRRGARGAAPRDLALIDRGPGFAEAEARWREMAGR